jgi:hypothetical protein
MAGSMDATSLSRAIGLEGSGASSLRGVQHEGSINSSRDPGLYCVAQSRGPVNASHPDDERDDLDLGYSEDDFVDRWVNDVICTMYMNFIEIQQASTRKFT